MRQALDIRKCKQLSPYRVYHFSNLRLFEEYQDMVFPGKTSLILRRGAHAPPLLLDWCAVQFTSPRLGRIPASSLHTPRAASDPLQGSGCANAARYGQEAT